MPRISRLLLVLVVLLACVGCDQTTKSIAREKLMSSPPVSLLNGLVRFEYTENPGAMLSLGAELPGEIRFLVLVVLVGAALAVTLAMILRTPRASAGQLAGLSLVIGGGVGNLIDRITNHGAAVDFVSLGLGQVRTGIFNVADVGIVAGMLIFLVFNLPSMQHTAPTSSQGT